MGSQFEKVRWHVPKAVGVTYEDFQWIETEAKKLGFREIPRFETETILVVYEQRTHTIVIRGEVGFEFTANGYKVRIWTSCLRTKVEQCRQWPLLFPDTEIVSQPPGMSRGWIVVKDSFNRKIYFARPCLRTKNFKRIFLRRTWITHRKIKKRPVCECRYFMIIYRKADGGTFWACFKKLLHLPPEEDTGVLEVDKTLGKPEWKDWDFALGPRALKIAKAWRKEYARYLRRTFGEGQKPQRARVM